MHWLNRILIAGLIAAVVAWGPRQLELAAGSEELARVEQEREELRSANATLRTEIGSLQSEVRALKTDPAEVARIAREDLNLVGIGEVVFEVERVSRPAGTP
ncbi:MAG: septum formation initiator family protein [Deltaproteobacteria bacterium]|nr:septum formation initiator family protein [Nannocystaceae bacterium]